MAQQHVFIFNFVEVMASTRSLADRSVQAAVSTLVNFVLAGVRPLVITGTEVLAGVAVAIFNLVVAETVVIQGVSKNEKGIGFIYLSEKGIGFIYQKINLTPFPARHAFDTNAATQPFSDFANWAGGFNAGANQGFQDTLNNWNRPPSSPWSSEPSPDSPNKCFGICVIEVVISGAPFDHGAGTLGDATLKAGRQLVKFCLKVLTIGDIAGCHNQCYKE